MGHSYAADYNFQHLKPTAKFIELTSQGQNSQGQNVEIQDPEAEQELSFLLTPPKIRNDQYNVQQALDLDKIPWDRVLKILAPFLLNNGQGKTQAPLNELLNWKHKFGGGIKNYGTIEWQEPLGYISVHARRELDEINTNKIEVNDILEVVINAEAFIKHLSNEKLVQISNDQLSAFANIKYHKIFHYKHYKNSLEEAQKADLSTLLFPYQFFNFPHLLKVKKEEEISHRDYLTLNVSGSASVNFWVFIKAGVSVYASLEHQQASVIKITKNAQLDDIFQLKKTIGTTTKIGIDASVALDLFKLIDLTLIKISFEHITQKEKTTFYHAPYYSQFENSGEFFKNDYKMGEEISTSKSVNVDSKFLLWGSSKSNENQFHHIKSEQEDVKIYQNWWAKESHVHSLFGGIVTNFLGNILGSFLGVSKKFSSHQEHSFSENSVDNEFQLEFSRSMYLDNRSSFWSLGKVKYMKSLIANHDLIPSAVKELWYSKWLHKKVYVNDRYSFSHKVFSHFQWLGPYDFQLSAIYLCGLSGNKAVDINSYEQPIKMNKLKWKQKICVKNSYDKLMRVTQATDTRKKTENFLDFIKYFLKHSPDNRALYTLFSKDLLRHQTTLMGNNKADEKFKGSYSRGEGILLDLNQEYLHRMNLWR